MTVVFRTSITAFRVLFDFISLSALTRVARIHLACAKVCAHTVRSAGISETKIDVDARVRRRYSEFAMFFA